VPDGFLTHGRRFWPGGVDVRDMLVVVAGDARADVQRRIDERDAALAKARTALATVEAALKEFD